jgi:PAS domain S-box-containing protein
MNLKTKLIAAFLIVALLVVAVGFVNIQTTNQVNEQFDRIISRNVPALIALRQIDVAGLKMMTEAVSLGLLLREKHQLSAEFSLIAETEIGEETAEYEQSQKEFETWLTRYETVSQGAQDQITLQKIEATHQMMAQSSQALVVLIQNGGSLGETIVSQKEDLESIEGQFEMAIEQAIALEVQDFEAARAGVTRQVAMAHTINSAAIIIATLLAIGLGLLVAQAIATPISQLAEAAIKIGQGQFEISIPRIANHEVGLLANAFQQMALDLQRTTVSKAYMDNIISSMVDMLIVLDQAGIIQIVNQATVRLSGYPESELLGKPLGLILDTDAGLAINDLWAKGRVSNVETHYRTKTGQEIPVLFSSAGIRRPDGQVEGWVCVALDITERKQIEEALKLAHDQAVQADRLKTELLSNVSHELRTPLAIIFGYAQIIQEGICGPITEIQQEAINKIVESSEQLIALITTLLDEALLKAGELQLNLATFIPSDLLNPILSSMGQLAQAKGLTLTSRIAADLPGMLVGDPTRLHQILFNLVNNAIKFTETGLVQVNIQLMDRNHWAIRVSDTGPGIPPEAQSFIFEPFRQVDGSLTRRYGGAGLGLTIVKQLAELMGGRVTLESTVDQGSIFTVLLPLHEPTV